MPMPTSPRTFATSCGKWSASIRSANARPASSTSWICCSTRATCCSTTARAPNCSTTFSASSSTSFRTPTRSRPKSCSCWRRPTPPSAIGGKRSRRPANCTWSAIRSSPFIDFDAPTRACSTASAARYRRRRGIAEAARQHAQYRHHPGVRQRGLRGDHLRLPAARRRRARSGRPAQRDRAADAGALRHEAISPTTQIEDCSPGAVAAFIQWLTTESGWKVRDQSTGERVYRCRPSTSAFSSAASPTSEST